MPKFEPRTYRKGAAAEDLVSFQVASGESDLLIQVDGSLRADLAPVKARARELVRQARAFVQSEIALTPGFAASLAPLPMRDGAPPLIRAMLNAGIQAGVGPMAAVAGAIAQFVGEGLSAATRTLLVENGGDLYLYSAGPRRVAIYAGRSPLSNRVALEIPAGEALGICSSSGTIGHSHSAGRADVALVAADDAAFADAVATALGNRVRQPEDVEAAIEWAKELDGVRQVLIIYSQVMGAWGDFALLPLPGVED